MAALLAGSAKGWSSGSLQGLLADKALRHDLLLAAYLTGNVLPQLQPGQSRLLFQHGEMLAAVANVLKWDPADTAAAGAAAGAGAHAAAHEPPAYIPPQDVLCCPGYTPTQDAPFCPGFVAVPRGCRLPPAQLS